MTKIKYRTPRLSPPSSAALDWLNGRAATDIHAKILLAQYINHLAGYHAAIAEVNYQHMMHEHLKPLTP